MGRRRRHADKPSEPRRGTAGESSSGVERLDGVVVKWRPTLVAFLKWTGFSGLVTILVWVAGILRPDPGPSTERFDAARARIIETIERENAAPAAIDRAIRDLGRLPRDAAQLALVSEDLAEYLVRWTRVEAEGCPRARFDAASESFTPSYVGRGLATLASLAHELQNPTLIRLPEGANLNGIELPKRTNLARATLNNTCLKRARLDEVGLLGANLGFAVLDSALLNGAVLDSARLEMAYLNGAQLVEATLVGARLTQADLRGAHLISADLSFSRLGSADLRGADLSGASLAGAYLRGAMLDGVRGWTSVASFEAANLIGVTGLSAEELDYARSRNAVIDHMSDEEWGQVRDSYAARASESDESTGWRSWLWGVRQRR